MKDLNMKTKPSLFIALWIFIALALSGCAARFIPSVVNTPMIRNKGEIQASATLGSSAFSPRIAYGITDHLGIMINSSFDDRDDPDNHNSKHKHHYAECAGGYYKPLGAHGVIDFYTGYGYGNIETAITGWSIPEWNAETDFINHCFFIQPSIGFNSSIIDFNIASKFCMTRITKNAYGQTVFFITPAATLKAGYKPVKLVAQVGLSIKTTQDTNENIDYYPLVFNAGLQFDLFQIYKQH